MLAVLNRYKVFLVIMALLVLALLLYLFIIGQNNGKTPTRGVFVLVHTIGNVFSGGGSICCSR